MTSIRKLALLFRCPLRAVMTSNCQAVNGSDSGSLKMGGDDSFLIMYRSTLTLLA